MSKVKYITRISQVPQIPAEQRETLEKVTKEFAFRTNNYYLSLINWSDENDPIKRIVIPDVQELIPWGRLDTSNELHYTKVPGLEHKYPDTALMLVNNVCGGYCRFCFRKRLFRSTNNEVVRDVSQDLEYIRNHSEITNVLLSGGDPLVMPTRKLERIIQEIRAIEHVRIIRIGTKMPAFDPYRILDDPSLLDMLCQYSLPEKRIYIMTNFDHPRELTAVAIDCLAQLLTTGTIIANQTPLIKGVNDDPAVLAELFRKLSFVGATPYYVFQCRPTLGNKTYALPIARSYEIFEMAKMQVSGLAKRARFIISHSTGKIEVAGMTQEHIYMRYHRAANPEDESRFMVFKMNPKAYWFDDFSEAVVDYALDNPNTWIKKY